MAIREFLERTALFNGIARPVVEKLAEAAVTEAHARGSMIWRVGEVPQALLFVKSGLVKLTRPAARGRTSLCGLFGAPTTLGELVLVKGMPYQNAAVAATANVAIVSIPRELVLSSVRSNPELALNLFCGFEEKFAVLHDKIDVLSAGSVEARLATLLVKLYAQFGDELADGSLRIGVPLSRQELADMVSTSFETAIRVLSRWEREGTVATDGDGFTIGDLVRLREVSGGLSASGRLFPPGVPARAS
jgi:CRP/FNR family transcriptional regulator, nitrogen oxide reductase regulator